MPPRYQARPTDLLTRVRNEMDALGRPGMAGTSRLGGNRGRGFGQASVVADGTQANDDGTDGSAHLLTMSVTAGVISSGGDTIPFSTVVAQHGFDDVVDPSGGAWVHPVSGVYMLVVKLKWRGSFTGGGTIQLAVDGTALPEGLIVQGDSGDEAFGVLPYRATAGSVGEVTVDHGDGSAQTCDALVSIAITDPDEVEATIPAGSDWELTFAADAYDLTFDGSSWWTTEGQSGVTVTERDATGVALSSFEATAVSLQGENRVRGITFDGTNLWVVGAYDSKVACYSTAGALVSSFIGDGGEQSDTGVAWDGSHLWASGLNLDQLRRYTTGGSHSSSVSCPDPGAMAVYDSTLYVIDPAGQQLRTFSLAGAEGTPVDISDAPINPTGVWIAADGTLYLSLDGVGVYRRLTAL